MKFTSKPQFQRTCPIFMTISISARNCLLLWCSKHSCFSALIRTVNEHIEIYIDLLSKHSIFGLVVTPPTQLKLVTSWIDCFYMFSFGFCHELELTCNIMQFYTVNSSKLIVSPMNVCELLKGMFGMRILWPTIRCLKLRSIQNASNVFNMWKFHWRFIQN